MDKKLKGKPGQSRRRKATELKRQPLAQCQRGRYLADLCKLIARWDKGVIAIDGEWEVGKTWVGDRLKADLEQKDVSTRPGFINQVLRSTLR